MTNREFEIIIIISSNFCYYYGNLEDEYARDISMKKILLFPKDKGFLLILRHLFGEYFPICSNPFSFYEPILNILSINVLFPDLLGP